MNSTENLVVAEFASMSDYLEAQQVEELNWKRSRKGNLWCYVEQGGEVLTVTVFCPDELEGWQVCVADNVSTKYHRLRVSREEDAISLVEEIVAKVMDTR